MRRAFINGEFFDLAEARISIFDRGILFGDSIYEVLPVYNGRAYFVERHLTRMLSNLNKIKIGLPQYDWQDIIERLILENQGSNLQVYIQITRGNQNARKHDIPSEITPTVMAFTIHNQFPTDEEKKRGLSAKLLEDTRWLHCDIKTTSLLGNILLNDDAVSSGFQTSILVRDGYITEGSTSNVFIVSKDGLIKTPPLNNFCLPGVTRQLALELIEELNWKVKEESFSTSELFDAQEVWITSTTKEIFPVTRIDNCTIGDGTGGSYWYAVNNLYKKLIN